MKHSAVFLVLSVSAMGAFPALADDWTGAYGGVSLGSVTFKQNLTLGGSAGDIPQDKQTGLGLFVGYQMQSGRLVYGGELAYSKASFPPDGLYHVSDTDLSYVDVVGRIGYSMGDALVYAKAGYSQADVTFTGPGVTVGTNGTIFGLGVDYKLQSSIILGVDYSVRNLEGKVSLGGGSAIVKENGNALTLRLGYKF